jgi:hypothetical protein
MHVHGLIGFIIVWLAIRYVCRQLDKIDVIERAVLHPTPTPVPLQPVESAAWRPARQAALVCENARMHQRLEQGVRDRVARERATFAALFPRMSRRRAVQVVPALPRRQRTWEVLAWVLAFVAFAGVLLLAGLHG